LGHQTECPWRLIADEGISTSSEDHGQQFGLPRPIDAASVSGNSGDLVIEFRGKVFRELFQMPATDEAWVHQMHGDEYVYEGAAAFAGLSLLDGHGAYEQSIHRKAAC
jgi:hypothetical protein